LIQIKADPVARFEEATHKPQVGMMARLVSAGTAAVRAAAGPRPRRRPVAGPIYGFGGLSVGGGGGSRGGSATGFRPTGMM
jgi:hypothetical protein